MKSGLIKLKTIIASVLAFLTVFGTTAVVYAEEEYTVPVLSDKSIFIGCGIFAVILIIGTCVLGTILRRAQNRAHKQWLEDNNMTEEELEGQAKQYKQYEKQRKAELKAKKKAIKQAERQAKNM